MPSVRITRVPTAVLLSALVIGVLFGLTACKPEPTAAPTPTRTPAPIDINPIPTSAPSATPPPTVEGGPTPIPPYGPTGFPPDVNPLTGLPVSDPAVLERRPLLVKISNNPPVVRPQAGLMFADHVWEHQTEGYALTRFTAVFLTQGAQRVGSVRSGRLIDLELTPMYQGIFSCSGFSSNYHDPGGPLRVEQLMRRADWFERNFSSPFGYGEPYLSRIPQGDMAFEHTLFANPDALWALADERGFGGRVTLEPGLAFDVNPPEGGTPTDEMTIDYPGIGPKDTWRYDATSGKWLRWTDDQPHADAITNAQLAFDNVVIVYAEHEDTDIIEDEHNMLVSVQINLVGEGQVIIFRDGQRYEGIWRRPDANSMLQLFDAAGNPLRLKPGTTWFHTNSSTFSPAEVTFLP